MATFSQRIGLTAATNPIQIESMSIPLRNSIWNLALVIVDETEITLPGWCVIAAKGFFKLPIDEVPQHAYYSSLKWLKENFAALSWAQVYEYSEFLAEKIPPVVFERNRYATDNLRTHSLHNRFNGIFESECSGYRFVGGILVPISNPAEVGEISTALQTTSRPELNGAHVHISSAMDLLAKKPDPDYRNSIKESISAVESVAKILSATGSQGIAGALDELSKKMPLHAALKISLKSMYGYTSDSSGIRHAILDEPNVGYDEAKFMLVTCSAFVNFLASKAQKAGLLT